MKNHRTFLTPFVRFFLCNIMLLAFSGLFISSILGAEKQLAGIRNEGNGFDPELSQTLIDRSSLSGQVPEVLNTNESRGAAWNGHIVAAPSRKNGNHVYYWEADNQGNQGSLSLNGISGGTWAISDIQMVGNDIYVSNMVNQNGQTFKVYRWNGVADTEPETIISHTVGSPVPPAVAVRLGDALSVIGNPAENGYIIASNFPFANPQNQLYIWEFQNGIASTEPVVINVNPVVGQRIGQYGRVTEVPGEPGHWLLTGAEMGIAVITPQGQLLHESPDAVIQFRAHEPRVFTYNGKRYISYTVNREWDASGSFFQVVDISTGGSIVEALQALTPDNIESKRVYTRIFGNQADAWISARHQMAWRESGQPSVMAFTTLNGFIAEAFTAAGISDDASLIAIYVDESAIEGFSPDILNYDIELPFGTSEIPIVTAETAHPQASLEVIQATGLPGTALMNVTAQDGETTRQYAVNFSLAQEQSSLAEILAFELEELTAAAIIDSENSQVSGELEYGTDASQLAPEITISPLASINPPSGSTQDFTQTVLYQVTAQDGTQKIWSVMLSIQDPSSDASLISLTYNDIPVPDFSADNLIYNIILPYHITDVPIVGAVASHPAASVQISQAGEIPGTASVLVTAQDEINSRLYEINFTQAAAPDYLYYFETLADKTSASGLLPEILDDPSSRSVAFNGEHIFAATRKNGNFIYVYNPGQAEAPPQQLNMSGVSGGTFAISDVRTQDQRIWASNMVMAAGQSFRVYRWNDIQAAPQLIIDYTIGSGVRLGDAISVLGNPDESGMIAASNFNLDNRLFIWRFEQGSLLDPQPLIVEIDLGSDDIGNARLIGQYGRINPVPGLADHYLLSGANSGIVLLSHDTESNAFNVLAEAPVGARSYDPQLFYHNERRFLSYAFNNETAPEGARYLILDIADTGSLQHALASIEVEQIEQMSLRNKIIGNGSGWNSSTLNVAFNADGEPLILASVAQRGFILERMFLAPAGDLFTVSFDIKDTHGQVIDDAVVVFAGQENEPGNYVFEVYEGTYSYTVNREGYFPVMVASVEVDQDMLIEVTLLVDDTGISEAGRTTSVYPNPAYRLLYFTLPENVQRIELFSLSGQLMIEQQQPGSAPIWDISGLKPGIYLIRIIEERQIQTHKIQIIKQ